MSKPHRNNLCQSFGVIALLVLAILPGRTVAQSTSRSQIITGAEIELAGIVKLADIVYLVQDKSMTSVDGFTYQMSLGGYAPNDARSWSVFIDGHKISVGVLETQGLNLIGVPISSIDSVVVTGEPGFRNGRFERSSTLEIYTRQAEHQGLGFIGSVGAANETGDPGPYRYVDPDRRWDNVDKRGPDRATMLTYDGSTSNVNAGIVVYKLIPSDRQVFERNRHIFDEPTTPEMTLSVPFASGRVMFGNAELAGRISAVDFTDMFFSQSINRELPVTHRQLHLNASARVDGPAVSYSSTLRHSSRSILNDERATTVPVDWHFGESEIVVSASPRMNDLSSQIGMSVVRRTATSDSLSAEDTDLRISAIVSDVNTGRWTSAVAGQVGKISTGVVGHLKGSAFLNRSGSTLSLSAGLAREGFQDSDPFFHWTTKGLRFLPTGLTNVRYPEISHSWALSSDADFSVDLDHGLTFTIGVGGRRHVGIPRQERFLVADGTGFLPDSLSYARVSGTSALIRTSASLTRGRWSGKIGYRVQEPITGGELFRGALRSLPEHQVSMHQKYSFASSFDVRGSLTVASSTDWTEQFTILDGGHVEFSTPMFARLDLSLRKGLFGNRINLFALVENVLNQDIRYHPLGAKFDRTLTVRASLKL